MNETIRCPYCSGDGYNLELGEYDDVVEVECNECKGSGEIDE